MKFEPLARNGEPGGARGQHPRSKDVTYSFCVPMEPIERLESAVTVHGAVRGGVRHLAASPAPVAPHLASWEVPRG